MCNSTVLVAPREGRVSRNVVDIDNNGLKIVAPREGRVSRNDALNIIDAAGASRAPRGACE